MGTRNNNHQLFPSDEVKFHENFYGFCNYLSRVWTQKNSKKGQNGDNHFEVD